MIDIPDRTATARQRSKKGANPRVGHPSFKRAVCFCLLIHAGPTKGGSQQETSHSGGVAATPCAPRYGLSGLRFLKPGRGNSLPLGSTFGSAEGPSRAVRNRTRLPRLTAEQASAPPTLGRPHLALRWPWGCAVGWPSKQSLSRWHHHGWHQRREIARKTAYPVGHACSPARIHLNALSNS